MGSTLSTNTSRQSMLTYQDLVNDMASGCKPRSDWRIGIEHEQFVYNLRTGEPLPYDGSPGIKQILESFISDYSWEGHVKNGYLIELKRDGAFITLEPGGQIELAGSPLSTVAQVQSEAEVYYKELAAIGEKLGFGILARGFHPQWSRSQIQWMPKERYRIMGPYMETLSKHGVDMMILTCGAQINLDFDSEADMIMKYRVGLGLQPLVTALMANSNLAHGKESGYKSFRSFIWTETDPDRCGVPEFVFDEDMGFGKYVDYALDVPMYLIVRDGHHHSVLGQSFRDFMRGELKGYEGDIATLDDWHYHLTTLFPEIRLKSYLEFRGPDSATPAEIYAMSALWTGLLYDPRTLAAAAQLIEGWSGADHTRIRNDVTRSGLETICPDGKTLRTLGDKVLTLAMQGLEQTEPAAQQYLHIFKQQLTDTRR